MTKALLDINTTIPNSIVLSKYPENLGCPSLLNRVGKNLSKVLLKNGNWKRKNKTEKITGC